eukprot:6043953-Amphidinium_carterae.1
MSLISKHSRSSFPHCRYHKGSRHVPFSEWPDSCRAQNNASAEESLHTVAPGRWQLIHSCMLGHFSH